MDVSKLQNNLEVVCKLGGSIKSVSVVEIQPFPMVMVLLTFEKGAVLRFEADNNAVDIFTVAAE